jgi:protease IV
MSLEADYVVDRRRLKRRLSFWRILAIVILAILFITSITNFRMNSTGDHIARLSVTGLIIDDIEREHALKNLKDDEEILALIVRIDSPGGTVVGGENLYHQLKDLGQNKPVVAVMGSTATSAGYMIALGADHLIAREGSLTGSIGVLLQTADITSLLEKVGIKPEIIKSGPLKAQPNPFEKTTQAARGAIESVVMDMYAMFVDIVAERRKMSPEAVRALADGRVYSGRQALANGLIDAIGGEDEAIDWLLETGKIPPDLSVKDVIIDRPGQGWRKFINSLVGKAMFSESLSLDGLFPLWQSKVW